MLASHSGDLVATDIIAVLWDNYKNRQPQHSMLYVDKDGQVNLHIYELVVAIIEQNKAKIA